MISAKSLLTVFDKCRDASLWASIFVKVLPEFEVNTDKRVAAFLAQCGHESNQFNVLRENLSYSLAGLKKTWPNRFPTDEAATPYVRDPQALANFVYASRLGNGPVQSGDGYKFRGGGLIQLTGRANYRSTGKAIGMNLEEQPAKIEDRIVAARAAGEFFRSHGCLALADFGKLEEITAVVNGPRKLGLAERIGYYEKLLEEMRDA